MSFGESPLSGLTVQEFTSFDALANLRREWSDLVCTENLGPAQSYEWLSTLWRLHSVDHELLVLVLRDTEGITGIVPLVLETEHRKGVRARLLRMLSGFHSLHGTPLLLGRRKQEGIDAVLDRLQQRGEEWTLWMTSYQVGDGQEVALFSALRDRGYPFSSTMDVRSPYQRLEESWEDELKTLQPRFRTALRSREKRLRERGRVELRFLDSPSDWGHGLAAIREIEEDSWKVGAGTAITVQSFQWKFYELYAPSAAKAGTLRIPVLYLDGEPIAYDYALYENGVYYILKTSYKNKWRDSYPGFVLRKMLVEWAYAEHAREIDYLGKDEDWKMKWTNSFREHRDSYIFSRTLAARYLYGFHRVRTLFQRKGQSH
jgi:CelD/BcsL family acetyltransferase involved in cellulose biosynthesis